MTEILQSFLCLLLGGVGFVLVICFAIVLIPLSMAAATRLANKLRDR